VLAAVCDGEQDEESPDIEFQYDDADSLAAEVAEVGSRPLAS
jgi:hypothetical protein